MVYDWVMLAWSHGGTRCGSRNASCFWLFCTFAFCILLGLFSLSYSLSILKKQNEGRKRGHKFRACIASRNLEALPWETCLNISCSSLTSRFCQTGHSFLHCCASDYLVSKLVVALRIIPLSDFFLGCSSSQHGSG